MNSIEVLVSENHSKIRRALEIIREREGRLFQSRCRQVIEDSNTDHEEKGVLDDQDRANGANRRRGVWSAWSAWSRINM